MLRRFFYYLRVWKVQLKNNWVREVVYRSNFLMMVIVDCVWMFMELALFKVIYANTETLGGWKQEQVFFFLGMFFASDALFTIFFQRNYWTFSDLVNHGDLDLLLTKPLHPLFLALTRWINLTAIFNVILGTAILIKYADAAGFAGGWAWLTVPFWMLLGLVTQLVVRFIFVIWVFWTERSFALSHLYFQFFTLATKPDVIYPKVIRYAILSILPFAFISSVPTRALIQGISFQEGALVVVVLSAFFFADRYLWKRGLQRYQSASS
jgi:ABC-2 type transport system permease protein